MKLLRCGRCKTTKPEEDFYTSNTSKRGRQSKCISCDKERMRLYWRNNPEYRRKALLRVKNRTPNQVKDICLKYSYGTSLLEFESLKEKQNNTCAICFLVVPMLDVDHCHDAGTVRGLLCRSCNLAIGQFKHNTTIMKSAISYLEKY